MSATTKNKKNAVNFDIAEWLANSDDFSHLDVDVYLSPRYKEFVSARRDFDALREAILGRDESQDSSTLGDGDVDQERLEELHDIIVTLGPEVEASKKTLRFVDATTKRELDEIDSRHDGDLEGGFFEMLTRFGLFDGEAKSLEEWEMLARRVGLWQWGLVQSECLEYLGRSGEVTPDFSLPSSPDNRE